MVVAVEECSWHNRLPLSIENSKVHGAFEVSENLIGGIQVGLIRGCVEAGAKSNSKSHVEACVGEVE